MDELDESEFGSNRYYFPFMIASCRGELKHYALPDAMDNPLTLDVSKGNPAMQRYRVLGTFNIAAICYFASCGGPIGSEPLVSAGGPLIGLTMISVYVLFCYLPFAYMVAELCSAFPENGGFAVWVQNAFGSFWGLQVGYWSWISNVLNNAIYPGLIYSTITEAYNIAPASAISAYFIKMGIAIILSMPTLIGVKFVAINLRLMLMLLFVAITIYAMWAFAEGAGDFGKLGEIRSAKRTTTAENGNGTGIDWKTLINFLFWSFDGVVGVSVVGGEVANPARTFSRGIALACGLTIITYALPLIATVTADATPWIDFEEDSYPSIAKAIGGNGLFQIVVTSSVLSAIGLYTSSLFCTSFLVCGTAEQYMIPPVFATRHERFESPYIAILVSMVLTVILSGCEFDFILDMTNAFGAAVQVAVIGTLVKLRREYPYLPRPTKVPGGMVVLYLLVICPTIVFGYIFFTTLTKSMMAPLIIAILLLPGLIFGWFDRRKRHASSMLSGLDDKYQRL